MRVTIELDTNDITDRDRRVLAALVSDDGTPLVLPLPVSDTSHLGVPDATPPPSPGMPSPTPAPPEFMQRLGEATAQFGRSPGVAHEARLPVVQQAGVTTRSTMPEDDDVDELVDDQAPDDGRVVGVDVARDTATVVTGAVRDGVVHIDAPDLHIVAPPPPAHADRDRVRVVTPPYPEPAPVRYTTP